MARELPSAESEPIPSAPLRLPEVYESPDRTIQEVAPHSLPPEDRPKLGSPNNHSQPRFGPVTTVTIDRLVLGEARRLAQGDLGRLVLRSDGTVVVANSADHARLIRQNRTFGIKGASRDL